MNILLAIVQILTALGTLAFWATWFREEHHETWLPPGYVEHERVFVWPDGVTAALLLVSGIGTLAGWPGAAITSYIAAGMLLFLALIDGAYFLQHGMLRRERGGAVNLAVLILTTTVAFGSIAYHATA